MIAASATPAMSKTVQRFGLMYFGDAALEAGALSLESPGTGGFRFFTGASARGGVTGLFMDLKCGAR